MFNKYELYTIEVDNSKSLYDNKVFTDIDILDEISDYKNALEFVMQNYALPTEKGIKLTYDNGIMLAARKIENALEVVAIKDNETIIFSKGWKFIPKKSDNENAEADCK